MSLIHLLNNRSSNYWPWPFELSTYVGHVDKVYCYTGPSNSIHDILSDVQTLRVFQQSQEPGCSPNKPEIFNVVCALLIKDECHLTFDKGFKLFCCSSSFKAHARALETFKPM